MAGTTRVVRLNQLKGTRVELLGRIDWDAIPPEQEEGMRVWVTPSNAQQLNPISSSGIDPQEGEKIATDKYAKRKPQRKAKGPEESCEAKSAGTVPPLPRDVQHIVVKDMRKGVVSQALVKLLADLYPTAEWFVSSKIYTPAYLQYIPENKLRLYLIPEMAALDAGGIAGITHWFCGAGKTTDPKPTQEALEAFTSLLNSPGCLLEKQDQALVVALPEEFRLLARRKK